MLAHGKGSHLAANYAVAHFSAVAALGQPSMA